MQSTPTPSLLIGSAPRLRACTTALHASLFLALLALGACRDPKVAAYRVPKESLAELPASKAVHSPGSAMPETVAPPSAVSPAPSVGGATAPDTHGLQTASGAGLTWAAPSEWQSKPVTMMRKATYVITDATGATAELAISAFPGDVGGDVANLNRWRGQVGLREISDVEALAAIERIKANGLEIGIVDVSDRSTPNGSHLIGAMVPFDGATWFFKLLGPDPVVANAKPAFAAFLRTIKPAAATP